MNPQLVDSLKLENIPLPSNPSLLLTKGFVRGGLEGRGRLLTRALRLLWLVLLSTINLQLSTSHAATITWSDGKSDPLNIKPPRIHVVGPGEASLSDIQRAVPKAPLELVDPGRAIWHLRAELVAEKGAKIVLHGTKIGGDVNELRLQSNNRGDPIKDIVFVRADYGTLDIRSTKITSWDDAVNGPDLESGIYRRSYIGVRSQLDTNDWHTAYESRMDIIDSDMGYLGSHDAEAYGMVWKVAAPKGDSPFTGNNLTNRYALVNVYGDIIRSRLHHNYFGMYSFGSYGQHFLDNEVDHNVGYGFDPHDDSDYLVIERNNVHHNGTHGIIASQRCNNAIVRNNYSWNNGHNGIMLHRYCDDSLVEFNRTFHNGDSGIALFDVQRVTVRSNTCLENLNAGIRSSVSAANCLIQDNEFAYGGNYGIYLYKGVDAPFPGDNGHPRRNRYINNYVHHNAGHGIFSTTADDNTFIGNLFEANSSQLVFISGQRNRLESNSIPRNVVIRTVGTAPLPSSTYARNQPALAIQLDPYSTFTFDDANGAIFDPEEAGLATSVATNGSGMTLNTVDINKNSFVQTRALYVFPEVDPQAPGVGLTAAALVTVMIWNTTGDLSKRWLTQASSSTRKITYKVGDLVPGVRYRVFKGALTSSYTADANGTITFQDAAVSGGVTEFTVMQ